MNLRTITALAALLTPIAALAQTAPQPPDPAFLQAAIAAIEVQRNEAQTRHAIAEANSTILNDRIAKLQARIAELEKKPAEPSK